MKIITDDGIYVQKQDIMIIQRIFNQFPAAILTSLIDRDEQLIIISNFNAHEFVKYTDPYTVEFLKAIDLIINYDDVKNLNEEELIRLGQGVLDQKNKIIEEYNSSSNISEKEKLYFEIESLNYQMLSIKEFIFFKRGKIKYKLPKGIEKPTKEIKGIKKFMLNMINKRNPENK